MALKVIGAGFGRTGTASLKRALEDLGFSRCYHMQEVFPNPAHIPVWQAAADGQPVDWPGATFYQELMAKYPDAKVVLSVRDPEAWYKSTTDTIFKMSRMGYPMKLVPLFVPRLRRFIRMATKLIWKNTFHDRFADKAYALSVFNAHIAEVKRVVPADKLLVYEVKQGWEPLCAFLEVPVPAEPFPRLNDSAAFNQNAGPRRFFRRRRTV